MSIEGPSFEKLERKVSWGEVQESVRRLAEKIREDGFMPDYLVGITIGGLIPLALLAEEFGIHDVRIISARSYEGKTQGELTVGALPADLKGKKIILIDEVAETGETLQRVSEMLQAEGVELKTATIAINTATCTFWPDFHVMESDAWLTFPWEKDVENQK